MSGRGNERGAAEAVVAKWEQWVAATTDRLMELDAQSGSLDDGLRLEVAAAFVCRKAIVERVTAMTSNLSGAAVLAATALVDDRGDVLGDDLAAAAALLTAVIDRVGNAVAAGEAEHLAIARASMSIDADLALSERLATELGQYTGRVAAIREQANAAERDLTALDAAAIAAAQVRNELETVAGQRLDTFARWEAAPAILDRYQLLEAEVRELERRCRDKVRPLPTVAVPSVEALGPLSEMANLRTLPWPAARAVMHPLLARIDRLGDAYDEARRRFGAVLQKRDDLRGLLHAFRDKAASSMLAEREEVESAFRSAETMLWSAPCDVEAAEPLVQAYVKLVNDLVAESTDSGREHR